MIAWQVAAFVAPIAITMFVWWMDWFDGKKTNINNTFIPIIAGMEFVDFSFLPPGIAAPLVAGLAVAALVANNALTHRGKP